MSSTSSDFSLPRLRTKFGERAFVYVGRLRETLPEDLRAVSDPRLKTRFFSLAFDVH